MLFLSLIQVLNPEHFVKESKDHVGGYSHLGGDYIAINAGSFESDNKTLRDRKTLVHEIGHTGGLIHTFELESKEDQYLVNGTKASTDHQGDQIREAHTDMEDDANFMNYTADALEFWDTHTNYSRRSLIIYFNTHVRAATQGQIQEIIKNYYEGNLNNETIPFEVNLVQWWTPPK